MRPANSPVRFTNASDAKAWKECRRRAWFDLHIPEAGAAPDAFEQLIMQAGMEHERQVLATLGDHQKARDVAHTKELMAARVPVIYQPIFQDDERRVIAQPDFLLLEDEGYRAADAKLARSITDKPEIRIQLAVYQRMLGSSLQTLALLGDGQTGLISENDLDKADEFLINMRALAEAARPVANFVASKCGRCAYRDTCVPEFQADGDLGQNYFVDGRAIPGLQDLGIHTLTDLAQQDADSLPDIPYFKGDKKRKAVLHAAALLRQEIRMLAAPVPINGTAVHFDIETNPLTADGSQEVYLWGFLLPPYARADFRHIWHDGGPDNDRRAWYEFLAQVEQLRVNYPDLVLVHFAPFEHQVIRRYANTHGDTEHPIVDWLLNGGGLFDLCESVKKSLILPTTGYGLKEICKHKDLVNFQWDLQESGSQWSVVRYHDFLASKDTTERERIKQEVLSYNRDDVRATRALELWLDNLQVPAPSPWQPACS